MASSQVEIALTSPFGCVLRKYNHHRERCRESTSRVSSSQGTTFHQNDNDRSSFVVGDHHVAARIDVVKNMNNSNVNNDAKNSNVGLTKKEKEDESLSSSNENNNNDPNRQSQILDRWAARKAKEMVSTIETEAELLENLGNSSSASSLSSLSETTLNNRGASSLVQIWEKRLNNLNHQPLKCNTTSRTSSLGSSDVGELMDESSSSSLYSDWVGPTSTDTNEAASSCSTPKVADIIKRLKENKYGDQQGQHTSVVLHHVASSPRFRGRRALTDLLMQMERDRHGELNNLAQLAPVSNFSQRGRGRIQSLLRLRLLKRHHESTTYEKKRQPKGSTIMHLRERFNVEVKQGSTTQPEIDNSRNTHLNQPESPIPVHNPIGEHRSNPIGSDPEVNMTNGCQNDNDDDAYDHTEACAHKPEEEEVSASSETVCLEAQNNIASHEVGETRTCYMVESDANHETKEEAELAEVKQDHSAETEINYVDNGTITNTEDQDEHASDEGEDYDDVDDDDRNDDDEHYYDWISPIARPRSYWEDRRQAWYKEMLDTASSDKREIRQLLERRTVSTFLSSDFRERMDKLMEYHIGSQTHFISSQEDDEDNGGRMGQLVSFSEQHIQRRGHNLEEAEKQEEVQKEEEEEEEEEEEMLSNNNGGYNETSDDGSQSSSSTNNLISSSPNMSSWSYRDNEAASDDSEDRVDESTTSSSTQPSQSPTRQCINPHSVEMDLICDMRGQMEQLYREMAEIRKSLKTCIDMQMMLQKSMKRDPPKKGNCCICYEKKVDSLLYRCGHMCTCMKCANELQWNSGKCPICRAPIADVVRVYVDA
ncbi:uncharacterized protein LOC114712343 [Neltuma alba]|uniref:uncharacterized protein LOC114712343 n=1 Tax=Neltuma alba TaxID=207710 RepID=UPI0010A3B1B9|nr:uncharacterized protein LOC114712343 [Prosopis alba]